MHVIFENFINCLENGYDSVLKDSPVKVLEEMFEQGALTTNISQDDNALKAVSLLQDAVKYARLVKIAPSKTYIIRDKTRASYAIRTKYGFGTTNDPNSATLFETKELAQDFIDQNMSANKNFTYKPVIHKRG